MSDAVPLVSVVLATYNRPRFLPLALEFYRWQTYPHVELIVIDDSPHPSPWVLQTVPQAQYIHLPVKTPLGEKLNHAIALSRGAYVMKMDDDDYYAPPFIEVMLNATLNGSPDAVSFLQPFLFLQLKTLDILVGDPGRCSGATLFFSKACWQRSGFRPLEAQVDAYFMIDHGCNVHQPQSLNAVHSPELFLQVRHTTHLWNNMPDGVSMTQYLAKRQKYAKPLNEIMPLWVEARYRELSAAIFHD